MALLTLCGLHRELEKENGSLLVLMERSVFFSTVNACLLMGGVSGAELF